MASGSVVYGTLPSLSLVLLQLKGWWQDVNLFHMTTVSPNLLPPRPHLSHLTFPLNFRILLVNVKMFTHKEQLTFYLNNLR